MLAWEPLAKRITTADSETNEGCKVIFFGFVAILFVLSIIATRDLLKQSIIEFQIQQTAYYEEAIRQLISPAESHIFQTAAEWWEWKGAVHRPITIRFQLLTLILSIAFPCSVMFKSNKFYSLGYLAIATIVVAVYINAAWIVHGS